jgi:hypothetical protein
LTRTFPIDLSSSSKRFFALAAEGPEKHSAEYGDTRAHARPACEKKRAGFSALVGPLASCTLYNMERIGRLPKTKQRFVMEMLDTVLAQASQ